MNSFGSKKSKKKLKATNPYIAKNDFNELYQIELKRSKKRSKFKLFIMSFRSKKNLQSIPQHPPATMPSLPIMTGGYRFRNFFYI
jgi:hypothetical protein